MLPLGDYNYRVPRKNPFPKREREICQRLREFRGRAKLSQKDFAMMAAMEVEILRSYELAKSQLNYMAAWNIITAFSLNPQWLATGSGPVLKRAQIPRVSELGVGPRTLFSAVYDRGLLAQTSDPEIVVGQTSGLGRWFVLDYLREDLKNWIAQLPDGRIVEFCARLKRFADAEVGDIPVQESALFLERLAELEEADASANFNCKDSLDCNREADSIADMSLRVPTWSELKKEVAQYTAERGQKAALATELGVSRQVLGNWLMADDQGAPNAELTLRLFQWALKRRGQKPK